MGDAHQSHAVAYSFTGAPHGSDDQLLALLAPFVGHRARAARWITTAGVHEPRFAPKQRDRFWR